MEGAVTDIKNLEIPQLQAMVSKYPWFSYAREVLLCKLVGVEPECMESRYKENLIFFPRRDAVLLRCRQVIAASVSEQDLEDVNVIDLLDVGELAEDDAEDGFEIDFEQIQKEAENFVSEVPEVAEDMVVETPVEQQVRPKYVVVGGDYFTKEDFAQLREDEKAAEMKLGTPADNIERELSTAVGDGSVEFDSMDFVTETLAAIYADQGCYDKAIEVYAKLILLYPEKSTYFASLVNEIKSKN